MPILMNAEDLQRFLESDFGQVARDFRVETADDRGVALRLMVQDRHLRPGGTVSGPAIFGLADVAVYLAILSRIGPVSLAVTTNCAISFLRKPQASRDLIAHATVLKLGQRLAMGTVLVFSEGSDGPVAQASLTYSIPRA